MKLRNTLSKNITKILLIPFIVILIMLILINGPIWVVFCVIEWIIFSSIIWISVGKYLLKKDKFRKKGAKFFIILLICYLFIVSIAVFPLVMVPVSYIRAEFNKAELERIVNELTESQITDEDKTIAILNWFERYSGNIYNLWGADEFYTFYFGDGDVFDCIMCTRLDERKPALWVLTSRCGMCGEHSALFKEMANQAGLNVRSVVCNGVDHVWAEVYINDSWIIVDPSNVVFRKNKSGYDLPAESFEKGHADITKNISYVFAEYSNGKKEDITYRYTNLSQINITTIDEKNNPIANVEIEVLSFNKFDDGICTGLKFVTDDSGKYTLNIGGGDVKFIAKGKINKSLYGEYRYYFEDNEYYNLTINLKCDWTKDTEFVTLLFITIAVLTILLCLFIFTVRKERI